MASRTLIALVLVLLLGGSASPCWAKKKKKGNDASSDISVTITEVNFASITIDSGNQAQQTYKVTNDTKVTLNGLPATTEDLLAGMRASITPSADNTVAVAIAAENPKAIPNKR